MLSGRIRLRCIPGRLHYWRVIGSTPLRLCRRVIFQTFFPDQSTSRRCSWRDGAFSRGLQVRAFRARRARLLKPLCALLLCTWTVPSDSKTWYHASVSLYTVTRRRRVTEHVLMACDSFSVRSHTSLTKRNTTESQ